MSRRPVVVIIGAGNVATHLARALAECADVAQVCATSVEHARVICDGIRQGVPIGDLSCIISNADYYIICVKDADIFSVASNMPRVDGVVVHTSGTIPVDILKCASDHYGVLYPLQTFSKSIDVDMDTVSFFTEASDEGTLSLIDRLAASISSRDIRHLSSDQRGILHIAAVFACNFTNLLWGASACIMQELGCRLADLEPLVTTTLSKAIANNPADVQTGPAARGDKSVMESQKDMLAEPWRNIYSILSQAIIDKSLNQPILKNK